MSVLVEIARPLWVVPDFFKSLTPTIGNATGSLNEIAKSMKTPGYADAWLMKHATYTADVGDYWSTPEEIAKEVKEKGKLRDDCDGHAGAATYGLRQNGYDAKFMALWGKNIEGESGHATSLVKEGDYTTVCNFFRIKHFTKNLKSVAEKWYSTVYGISLYKATANDYEFIDHIDCEPKETDIGSVKTKDLSPELKKFVKRIKNYDKDFENIVKESRKRFM